MNIEKFVNSKWYAIMDWILKLLIINALNILLSLLVLPMFPAYIAGFATIKYYKEDGEGNIFKIYFSNFKEYFNKAFLLGILFIAIFTTFGISILHYYDSFQSDIINPFFVVGFYFIIFCSIILLILVFHLPMVVLYFDFNVFDTIRFAFFMSFRFFTLTLMEIIIWGLSVVIFLFATPLWVFIGVAVPLYLSYILSKPYYWRLGITFKEFDELGDDDEDEED